MILHTVNKSPQAHRALASCLQFLSPGDAVVLLEDGVYAATSGVENGLDQIEGNVYALQADAEARGLSARIQDSVTLISYNQFVDLCTEFDTVKNWS